MRTLALVLLSFSLWTISPTLAASLPDSSNSRVSIDKTTARADGIDSVRVVVTLKDQNLLPLENTDVRLHSLRGPLQDEIIAEQEKTDILGKARFLVRSLRNGPTSIVAYANGISIGNVVSIQFQHGLALSLQPGDLIKIPDDGNAKTLNDTAVYYYAVNGKRYVFPHEKVYFTWYTDFSNVRIIPIDQMSLVPIGGNVTHHPGSRLVKFQTDPKTYIVTRGGVLRWAKTEDVARGWFGANWNQFVDDITEGFYVNYKFGEPVSGALDLAIDVIRTSTNSIDQDKGLLSP